MTNEDKAVSSPETQTQEEAMPTSEQQTTPEAPEEAAPQQEVSEPAPGTENLGLPEGASERTAQQFDKLQTQLRDERSRRLRAESAAAKPAPAQTSELDQFVDPVTGVVDVQGLNKVITDTSQRAKRAEDAIGRFEKSSQDRQEREALTAHPELDPQGKDYREDLYTSSRAILMDSMVYPESYGGKTLTLKEAADRAKANTGTAVQQAKQEGAKEAREKLTPKEQASLEATGRSDRRTELSTDMDSLRLQTRKGDLNSVVERLKSVGKS